MRRQIVHPGPIAYPLSSFPCSLGQQHQVDVCRPTNTPLLFIDPAPLAYQPGRQFRGAASVMRFCPGPSVCAVDMSSGAACAAKIGLACLHR